MPDEYAGRCGLDCLSCPCRESMGCPGCKAVDGKPFWGECSVAKCCGYAMDHCGECPDCPCVLLREYAFDPDNGDNGQRLETLRAWTVRGVAAWRSEQGQ